MWQLEFSILTEIKLLEPDEIVPNEVLHLIVVEEE